MDGLLLFGRTLEGVGLLAFGGPFGNKAGVSLRSPRKFFYKDSP